MSSFRALAAGGAGRGAEDGAMTESREDSLGSDRVIQVVTWMDEPWASVDAPNDLECAVLTLNVFVFRC